MRLTLWRPLLSLGYSTIKHLVPDRVKPSVICNFWHPGTLTLSPERQSARMSKITDDGLTRGLAQDALRLYPYDNTGCQRVQACAYLPFQLPPGELFPSCALWVVWQTLHRSPSASRMFPSPGCDLLSWRRSRQLQEELSTSWSQTRESFTHSHIYDHKPVDELARAAARL